MEGLVKSIEDLETLKNKASQLNKYTDIMIDIETLDTKPTAVILSIAAVAFKIESGQVCMEKFDYVLNYQEQIDNGRTTSIDTLLWWGAQSEEAKLLAFAGNVPLHFVIREMTCYLLDYCVDNVRVWANSPSFDLVILKDAYNQNVPWNFWNERDVRTLTSLFPNDEEKVENNHIAIDDCINQINQVCNSYAKIKSISNEK